MTDVYYDLVERIDGWHVQPVTRSPVQPPSPFPTRAAAEAWCRAQGGIPLTPATDGAITIAPANPGIGADVQDASPP